MPMYDRGRTYRPPKRDYVAGSDPPVKRTKKKGRKNEPRLHPTRKRGVVDIVDPVDDKRPLRDSTAEWAARKEGRSVRYTDERGGVTVRGPRQADLSADQRAEWNRGLPEGVVFETPSERREYDAQNEAHRRRREAYMDSPEGRRRVEDAREMVEKNPHMARHFLSDPLLADDPYLLSVAGSNPLSPQEKDTLDWRRGRADTVFELTAKQRARWSELAEAKARINASDDYTEAQKAEASRRIDAKLAGIKAIEQPKAPTPAEKFEARTFRHPQTGAIYPLDENGVPGKPIYEEPAKEPTRQDRINAVKEATTFAMNNKSGEFDRDMFQFAMQQMGFDGAGAGSDAEPPPGYDTRREWLDGVVRPQIQTKEGFRAFLRMDHYNRLTPKEKKQLARWADRRGYLDD